MDERAGAESENYFRNLLWSSSTTLALQRYANEAMWWWTGDDEQLDVDGFATCDPPRRVEFFRGES